MEGKNQEVKFGPVSKKFSIATLAVLVVFFIAMGFRVFTAGKDRPESQAGANGSTSFAEQLKTADEILNRERPNYERLLQGDPEDEESRLEDLALEQSLKEDLPPALRKTREKESPKSGEPDGGDAPFAPELASFNQDLGRVRQKSAPYETGPQDKKQKSTLSVSLRASSRVSVSGLGSISDSLFEDPVYDSQTGGSGKSGSGTLSAYERFENHAAVSNSKMQSPKSPFLISQGSVIPAMLISGINSDLPGQITAQVTRDVLDSPQGRYLLIPAGARLIGQYGSGANFGDERVFLGFSRLIFPDGRSLDLGAMPGMTGAGYSGLDADVDHHYGTLFTGALLMATIGMADTAASDMDYRDSDGNLQMGSLAAKKGISESSDAARSTATGINISPTLTVEPGLLFNVAVTQDLYFDGPWRYIRPRLG